MDKYKAGDKIIISIYDCCSGKATIIDNDIKLNTLLIAWDETPLPCYVSSEVNDQKEMLISYSDIASIEYLKGGK